MLCVFNPVSVFSMLSVFSILALYFQTGLLLAGGGILWRKCTQHLTSQLLCANRPIRQRLQGQSFLLDFAQSSEVEVSLFLLALAQSSEVKVSPFPLALAQSSKVSVQLSERWMRMWTESLYYTVTKQSCKDHLTSKQWFLTELQF